MESQRQPQNQRVFRTLQVRHKGVSLRYRCFDKEQRVEQGVIVENKWLSKALAWVAEQ